MGSYLNPGSVLFRGSLRSKIYVDKSGLIEKINDLICTEQKYVCVSQAEEIWKVYGGRICWRLIIREMRTQEHYLIN